MLVLTLLLTLSTVVLPVVDATASPSTTWGSKTPTGNPIPSTSVSPTGNPSTTSSPSPTGSPSTTGSPQPTYTVGAGATRIRPIGERNWYVAFGDAFAPGQEVLLSRLPVRGFPHRWYAWTLDEGRTTISMRNEHFELCLDPGAAPASGTGLSVQECDGSARQVWHVEGRRIRWSCGDLCLDLPGGRKTTQPLQLWACTPGNRNQLWTRSKY